ncbi:transporter substrate-binding domain-containing protein [Aliiglaciecola sp. LCG003]|uniref:substrate-binding periplasmic protein n=1 Tax=Aliiglaciecola sp. LCG003 TaxID=3053655 RepID=UPI002573AFF6|nr:transporter substrate-binding domain-containing protein [Aliiglaciecola sp. LCG003]WJG09274.1 transporter substrate-binding domain-containing protein [Aliiglaciecola sp. LCG003]
MFLFASPMVLAKPEPVLVAVGWNKPPYVIQQTQSGFELELVSAVLKQMGYEVKFVFVPYGRSFELLRRGNVDAAITMSDKIAMENVFLTDPYVAYQNVAVSLLEEELTIHDVDDLRPYSVLAFQNAQSLLGDKFFMMASNNPFYSEVPDQLRQVKMLFGQKVQVIVLDVNIFSYFSRQKSLSKQFRKVSIHPLFEINRYRVGFGKAVLRDQFNLVLAAYTQSPEYRKLQEKYSF